MPPRVSIVMPSLDQARFFDRALESVLGQTGPFELECIVVDGGSTDGSVDVLRSYGDRIRWSSRPDGGQSEALNTGFARATGDILHRAYGARTRAAYAVLRLPSRLSGRGRHGDPGAGSGRAT